MLERLLLLSVLVLSQYHCLAQVAIPFEFTSEDENRLIKETDSVKYYVASGDTTNEVSLNEETSIYRLINKNHKVIAEGQYILEGEKYLQTGKWTERFDNGKIKAAGYFLRSRPVGTWQEFFANGKISIISNYAILSDGLETSSCMSGTYQEFYQSGKLKVSGLYSAKRFVAHDTITVQDPVTNAETIKIVTHGSYVPEKAGHWEYYSENGELDKGEEN